MDNDNNCSDAIMPADVMEEVDLVTSDEEEEEEVDLVTLDDEHEEVEEMDFLTLDDEQEEEEEKQIQKEVDDNCSKLKNKIRDREFKLTTHIEERTRAMKRRRIFVTFSQYISRKSNS